MSIWLARVRGEWIRALLIMTFALAWGMPAGGAIVNDLYTIVLEQDPTADNPRSEAIRRAMSMVLVRVTGSRNAAIAPELVSIINDAERRYLNSYAILDGGEVRVGFIAAAVDAALEALNWPVWGVERPATMVWVAVDDPFGGRAILSTGELDNLYQHSLELTDLLAVTRAGLERAAYERGLPISLPVMDLDDMIAIDFADIWDNDIETLGQASMRYMADAIAVARVSTGNFSTSVEWTLNIGGRQRILLGTSLEEGIEWLAEQFAQDFGVQGGSRPMTLTITGISTLNEYGRVMSYLSSVSILDRVDVRSFDGDTLTLQVASRGDETVLSRVLTLNNLLIPVPREFASDPFSSGLEFQVNGGTALR